MPSNHEVLDKKRMSKSAVCPSLISISPVDNNISLRSVLLFISETMKVLKFFSTLILCNILSHMNVTSTLIPFPTVQVVTFHQLIQRFQRFMEHPPPKEEILRTRDLLPNPLKTKRVHPTFIVANRCRETVGLKYFEKPCFVSKSMYLKLPVIVYDPNETQVMLNVKEHLECDCKGNLFPITTQIIPTIPTQNETERDLTNSGYAVYYSSLILIVSQLFLTYLFI